MITMTMVTMIPKASLIGMSNPNVSCVQDNLLARFHQKRRLLFLNGFCWKAHKAGSPYFMYWYNSPLAQKLLKNFAERPIKLCCSSSYSSRRSIHLTQSVQYGFCWKAHKAGSPYFMYWHNSPFAQKLLKNCSKLLVVKVVKAESTMSAVCSTVLPPSLIVFISNVSKASWMVVGTPQIFSNIHSV